MKRKKYKVREGSIAWHIIQAKKPLQIIGMSAAILAMFTAFSAAAADDLEVYKLAYADAQIEEDVKPAEKVAETGDFEPKTWDVPLDYDLQIHITQLCEEANIEPELVLAVIEQESGWNADCIGDNGNSYGLMQVQERWHSGRMDKLGCDDLLDPYQNVTVGIDILAEKLDKYDTAGEALTAYNAGDSGAYNLYFSKGIYASSYAAEVMATAEKLKAGDQ